MTQVTIQAIKRTPKISKRTKKPFVSLGILTAEYPDRWLSGFNSEDTADWDKGMTVEIDVEDTGQYLNFTPSNGAPRRNTTPTLTQAGVSVAEIINVINFKVIPALEMLSEEVIRIGKKIHSAEYPVMNSTNDASGLDWDKDGKPDVSDAVPF